MFLLPQFSDLTIIIYKKNYPSIQKHVGIVSILVRKCDLKRGSTEQDRKLPTGWNVC